MKLRLEGQKRQREEEEQKRRQQEVERVRNEKRKVGRTHQIAVKVIVTNGHLVYIPHLCVICMCQLLLD